MAKDVLFSGPFVFKVFQADAEDQESARSSRFFLINVGDTQVSNDKSFILHTFTQMIYQSKLNLVNTSHLNHFKREDEDDMQAPVGNVQVPFDKKCR